MLIAAVPQTFLVFIVAKLTAIAQWDTTTHRMHMGHNSNQPESICMQSNRPNIFYTAADLREWPYAAFHKNFQH